MVVICAHAAGHTAQQLPRPRSATQPRTAAHLVEVIGRELHKQRQLGGVDPLEQFVLRRRLTDCGPGGSRERAYCLPRPVVGREFICFTEADDDRRRGNADLGH